MYWRDNRICCRISSNQDKKSTCCLFLFMQWMYICNFETRTQGIHVNFACKEKYSRRKIKWEKNDDMMQYWCIKEHTFCIFLSVSWFSCHKNSLCTTCAIISLVTSESGPVQNDDDQCIFLFKTEGIPFHYLFMYLRYIGPSFFFVQTNSCPVLFGPWTSPE